MIAGYLSMATYEIIAGKFTRGKKIVQKQLPRANRYLRGKFLLNQMQTFRTFHAFHLNEIIIHSGISPFILRVSGSLEDLSTFL